MLRSIKAAAVAACLLSYSAWAAEPAVLQIARPGQTAGAARLDLDAIKGLGSVTFETSTPWTDGKVVFEAVPGDRLLALLGGAGSVVHATALDDYSVEIPLDDFKSGKAHIAYSMNGEPLPEDQFGPYWVVYRYDSDPALTDEAHQARSIWQLKSLSVR
jgi:hypothetical protein